LCPLNGGPGDPPPRLPRDNLLVYRGPDGKPVPVKAVADWAKRRAEVVRGMQSVMGKLPGDEKRGALDVKVVEEVDGRTHVRRLITYASEPGGRVPAYLLIPKAVLAGKKKAPAVLCLHGTNHVIGHGIVVGLGTNRGYAVELAERGYVTLAPNYPPARQVSAGPKKPWLGDRHSQGRLGQHPRPRPLGLAAIRGQLQGIRDDRPFAGWTQFRLHGGFR
jgi:acetyl esterase/lipase